MRNGGGIEAGEEGISIICEMLQEAKIQRKQTF